MFVFIFKGVKVRNYSANNIMECPVGQKSYKSIQICQIFLFFDIEICFICKDLKDLATPS